MVAGASGWQRSHSSRSRKASAMAHISYKEFHCGLHCVGRSANRLHAITICALVKGPTIGPLATRRNSHWLLYFGVFFCNPNRSSSSYSNLVDFTHRHKITGPHGSDHHRSLLSSKPLHARAKLRPLAHRDVDALHLHGALDDIMDF